MPQLDKFTFFHQIVWLTFFFFLIYFLIRRYAIPRIHRIILYRFLKIIDFRNRRKNWAIRVKNNEIFSSSFFLNIFDIVKSFNLKFYNFYKNLLNIEMWKSSFSIFLNLYKKDIQSYLLKLKKLTLNYNI